MVATKSVKVYPETYRRLRRAAKARKQTLAVVMDEATLALNAHVPQSSIENHGLTQAGSDMPPSAVAAADDDSSFSSPVDAASTDAASASPVDGIATIRTPAS